MTLPAIEPQTATWLADWAAATPKILGIDFSKYQGDIDLSKAINAGANFFFCRVGGGYKDTGKPFIDDLWDVNSKKLTDCGKPWAGYWYFIPKNVDEQLQWLLDEYLYQDYWMPLAIDCEKWWTTTAGLSTAQASDALEDFANGLTIAGVEWQIYTRKSFWDVYYQPRTCFSSNDLWVAHWGVDNPAIPKNWLTYRFHQWSGDGNGRGAEFGAESSAIDLDYFNGDAAAFNEYLGLTEPYPFMVQVTQPVVVRVAPDAMSTPLWVAPLNTRLGVIGGVNDDAEKLWFDVGSGWIRGSNTVRCE